MTYAITGATGGIGGRVARRLAAGGAEQVLVARRPDAVPELAGARTAAASYDEPDALRAAFAGCDTVLLVSAAENAERIRQHYAAVDAAVAAGARRIVYTSFLGASLDSTFTLARHHAATEERIRQSGVTFTFLRDGFYQDLLPSFVGEDGAIRAPAGDGAISTVTRDDIADVAAGVLLADDVEHADRIYDVTGPAALDLHQIAAELSAVSGSSVRYEPETVEEAYASRAKYGAPDFEVEGWVTSYTAIAAGELAQLGDAVLQVAGHPPVAFADFLRAHPESWANLRPA